jgi:hypothetical protein
MDKDIRYAVFLFLLFSVSCIEQVDYKQIKAPEPKLVINSYITPDSLMDFYVNKTVNMVDTLYAIKQGSIEIWEDNHLLKTLNTHKNGYFKSSYKPEINHTYKIIVKADGMQATAQTVIPDSAHITDLSYIYPAGEAFDTYFVGKYAQLFITIDDPVKDNYYELFVLGYWPTDNIYNLGYIRSNNRIITAEGDTYTTRRLLFSDQLFNGEKIVLNTETIGVTQARPIYIEGSFFTIVVLRTVSKEYYLYRKTLSAHIYNQGIIDLNTIEAFSKMQLTGTPIDVYSNIEGGYGIFAGYSSFIYTKDNHVGRDW